MKRKNMILALAGLLLITGLISGCGNPIERHRDFMINKISHELDLTEPQKESLRRMHTEIFSVIKSHTNEQKAMMDGLIELVKSDSIDSAKLEALHQTMQSNHQVIQNLVQSNLIEFHKTLTPAQKEKAAKMIEDFYAKMQKLMQ